MTEGPLSFAEDGDPGNVRPRGELDLATAPRLEERLDGLLRAGATVTVDLSGLGFIDSSGLRVLAWAVETARGRSCALIMRDPQPQVLRVMELGGMTSLLSSTEAGSP